MSLMNAGARLAAVLAGAALTGYGVYSSARISQSEFEFHRNTIQSVQTAVRLDPARGRYHAWLAELLENDGRDGAAELAEAARLNPMDSRVWIRRALDAEAAGDPSSAESLLLHAASIDRLMEPRWSLMNFYFRAGQEPKFWPWARRAFDISYGDRKPLFELCWRMRDNAAIVESAALPPSYPIRAQFVRFLLEKDRPAEAASLAARIAPEAPPADTALLAACADRLALSDAPADTARALTLWNALCRRRLLPFAELDPEAGRSLTNGSFDREPTSLGFDWRIPKIDGVSVLRTADPRALRFTLSHKQPDACDLLVQIAPVAAGRRYRLSLSYRTSGIAPASGLRFRAGAALGPDLSSESWTSAVFDFTPADPRAALTLEYRRPLGMVRAEGTLELASVSLESAR